MCSETVTSMSYTFCIEKANQEKNSCMATTARFVWSGVCSDIQLCLDLPEVNLVRLRVVWPQ